jgi:flagellar basal body-associated protein FliL
MIRNELLSGFNNILGDGTVQEIYFPEFAIQ